MTLYAYDSKVLGPASTLEDTSQIQNDIDLLSVWAKSWLLTFNVSKCHVLHFGHKNINTTYSLYGQLLSPVLEDCDLGVIVDNDLKFSTHAKKAAASASSSLGLTKRTMSSHSPKILSLLYKDLFSLRLETGMVLASPFFKKDAKILEDVQRRAIKMVSGLHELLYPARLCKLKLPTLVHRRRQGDAILVHKLINTKAVPGLLPLGSQDSHTRGHNLKLSRHFSSKWQHAHFLTSRVPTSGTNYCQIPLLPKPQTSLRTILTMNVKTRMEV